jgi:hypothetical protein
MEVQCLVRGQCSRSLAGRLNWIANRSYQVDSVDREKVIIEAIVRDTRHRRFFRPPRRSTELLLVLFIRMPRLPSEREPD